MGLQVLIDLRRRRGHLAHRQFCEAGVLVRQRVGLLEPPRRPGHLYEDEGRLSGDSMLRRRWTSGTPCASHGPTQMPFSDTSVLDLQYLCAFFAPDAQHFLLETHST